jgi:16S rRNA (adenine1518-N6/adenine1519-N6)-dimethyltransferase
VLEIGCGLGSLTGLIARASKQVFAVELDKRLAEIARATLRDRTNVRVVHADILKITPSELGLPEAYVVAANIPYYVTSPILQHLLGSRPRPRRIVLTVQKEVAERICADPPKMSVLAISVQIHGRPELIGSIPAAAFYPAPKVDSAIVRIDCYDQPLVPEPALPEFFKVVKAGFAQPRKMLRNSLSSGLRTNVPQSSALLQGVDIDPQRRAETLSLADWIRLSEAIRGNWT